MFKKLIAGLAAVAFIILVFTGPALAADSDILARVGNKNITRADIEALISFYPPNQQAIIRMDPKNEEALLNNYVAILAVAETARRQGFDKEKNMRKQIQILSDEHLAKNYVQKNVIAKVKVSDKDVEEYYKNNPKEFEKPETVKVRHILIGFKGEMTDDQKKELRKKAEDVLKKAKGGDDFAKLASEYSDDPGSKTKGGELGYFPRGNMVPEFENAAFGLKPGEISDVIETPYGYHIIKAEDKKAAEMPAFDSIKDQVRVKATQAAEQKRVNDFVEKAKKDTKTTIYAQPKETKK
ncbi:MAG TPA: peptidylprolyl isomerase [Syntrophales bacterium]|jgi:peptidyl-prolyl cis-trans isomerase C|nr:peptidylprolyl isomerase [Syntrophales bacterium]HOX93244.1 peptidylprolyl isomerase [Syntrophales bacterium]HPI56282.1 peptidylprolyl isomerase [Syntrophales bacterium]HPN24469.1 peptidylprolyl isomerase [Syntrophales bacterium]HQM29099.1 peptidylprolyl isomerase [Syntrophales bacterium]